MRELMDAEAARRTLRRVAAEVVEATGGAGELGVVGIRRGGAPVAAILAEEIARRAMAIAADICVYTNGNLTVESISA